MVYAYAGLVSKPHMLLGHFSSIITTLHALPSKPWLVSTDREGKIRVSKLPKDPMQVDHNFQVAGLVVLPHSALFKLHSHYCANNIFTVKICCIDRPHFPCKSTHHIRDLQEHMSMVVLVLA